MARRQQFVTVRIPETGAYWDCPEQNLKRLGLDKHVVKGKAPKASADRPKSRKPKAPTLTQQQLSTPAETEEESSNVENPH